ncbi:unnamed protein product [Heligmosomoides polygyrus]|uniref:Uncharacterized protein n=1 Tax=Heligmosomoides polygyrus TaxID=6339 RepID=A0A183FHT5_HELPZ|nr:unnamed protein product [Heligmosomoides polygyrus]
MALETGNVLSYYLKGGDSRCGIQHRRSDILLRLLPGSFNTTQSLGGDEPEIVEDALSPKQGSVDLIGEAASLREKVLRLSEDVNSLIKRRKRVDAECRRTASQLSVSPRALSGHV